MKRRPSASRRGFQDRRASKFRTKKPQATEYDLSIELQKKLLPGVKTGQSAADRLERKVVVLPDHLTSVKNNCIHAQFDAPPPILNSDFLLNGGCKGIEQDFIALEQCKLLHYNCYCAMGPSTRNILFGEGKNYVGPILQGFYNVYQVECPISPFALQKCYRCRITLLEQMKQRYCMDCRYEFYSAANDEDDQLSVDLTEAEGCPAEAEEVVSTVSLLDLVELIWIPTLKAPTILIIEIVKFLIAKSVESQNLISKRLWTTVSETLIPFQKFLKAKKNHAITFSFEHWKQALNDADLFTTFSQFQIELTQRDLFLMFTKRVFTEYLLSLSTSTTSTSSTTVTFPTSNADVCASIITTGTKRKIEEIFAEEESHTPTYGICPTISYWEKDRICTLKSQAMTGCQVIQLTIYPFGSIAARETRDWWKQTKTKLTYVIQNIDDPVYKTVKTMQQQVEEHLLKTKPEKEVKKRSFFNSAGGSQQAP
ncbi:hypothetical protein CBL_08488 [Carabus blaptoides fortunei]